MTDEQELFEAAILFTDMRGSSEIATSTSTHEFFRILNASLSEQTRIVRAHKGQVLKYTGDGLMAVFRGADRHRCVLQCACELAEPAAQGATPFGVGVSDGRVIAGMVGDAAGDGQLRRYDVIGATVHLASRLCSMAEAAEVVATRHIADASGLHLPIRDAGLQQVRGFAGAIDCVSIAHDAP